MSQIRLDLYPMTDPHHNPPPFQWDAGNLNKLDQVKQSGRNVTVDEIESVFSDPDHLTETSYPDPKTGEPRYKITGLSNLNRVISVIFVLRDGQIRVFNVWRAKQTALKNYYGQTTDTRGEEAARAETDPHGQGDQSPGE